MSVLVLGSPSAQAHAMDSGDTLTLSLDTPSTLAYGATIRMTAVLTLPTPPPASENMGVSVQFSSTKSIGSYSPTISDGGLVYTFSLTSVGGHILAGQYPSLVATFRDTSTSPSQTITSNPVSLTITPAPTKMTCRTSDGNVLEPAGSPLGIAVTVASADGAFDNTDIDMEQPTYSISFTGGPSPVSVQHLTPDFYGVVTVTTPAQIGKYHLACAFDGTTDFAPTQTGGGSLTISEERAISSVQLYATPALPAANQPFTVYVVVKGPAGAPTPTGGVDIEVMSCLAKHATLSASGTALVTVSTGCPSWGVLTVWYDGDIYYYGRTFHTFGKPFTPIPASVYGGGTASGSGGGSGGNAGHATGSKAKSTATPSATMTPGSATSAATPPSTWSSVGVVDTGLFGGMSLVLLLAGVLVVVVLAGGVGAIVVVSRRAKTSAGATSASAIPPHTTQAPWPPRNDAGPGVS